jgi:flagellar hook-associated protein 3 FlgL
MSSGIGSIGTGYGFLNTLVAHAGSVHQKLNTLNEQGSTGLIAQTYAGLGTGAVASLNLNPQLTALKTYKSNTDQATGQMQVTQTAMTQLQKIAATFVAEMPKLNNLKLTNVDSIAAQARDALTQVAGLLNTQDGNIYVFGRQDSTNPPVPSAGSSLTSVFYTQINTAVSNLSTNGTAATTAATLAIAGSNATGTSPFSAYMSQPASSISVPIVQTGEDSTMPIGLLASANANVTSTGTSTTGSYMRDLMRALATIGSMSSSQVNDPNFTALVQDTQTSLTGVVTAMAGDAGVLGNRQAALTSLQSQLSDTATALTGQVSAAQDVDMTATLANLTAMQTQLQISYRMITTAGTLSLASFMSAS